MMKSMKNNIAVLLMIIFISHTIRPVNADGKRGKISRYFKLVFGKFIMILKYFLAQDLATVFCYNF